jgi:hypothetical protein
MIGFESPPRRTMPYSVSIPHTLGTAMWFTVAPTHRYKVHWDSSTTWETALPISDASLAESTLVDIERTRIRYEPGSGPSAKRIAIAAEGSNEPLREGEFLSP